MIAAAALSAAASVSAQVPPAESAEHAVLDAINGGHADRAALVTGAFSSKAFADEAAANDELEWLDRIATDSEGLALVSSARRCNQGPANASATATAASSSSRRSSRRPPASRSAKRSTGSSSVRRG